MAAVNKGNGFSKVIQHLDNLKQLLNTLSVKLGSSGKNAYTAPPPIKIPVNKYTLNNNKAHPTPTNANRKRLNNFLEENTPMNNPLSRTQANVLQPSKGGSRRRKGRSRNGRSQTRKH